MADPQKFREAGAQKRSSLPAEKIHAIACTRLYKHGSTATTILKYECRICRAERETKRLVAVDPDDPRFAEGFSLARGNFPYKRGEVPRK